jgi:hypothetical protein
VAYACNLSYLGGRHQENGDLRPAQENSLQDHISNTQHKKRLEEWLKWESACIVSVEVLNSNPSITKISDK